ncbi:MAG: sulfatase [Actinomycetota bacterium]|nr:sulfatase [Actinomycetota bacterium]
MVRSGVAATVVTLLGVGVGLACSGPADATAPAPAPGTAALARPALPTRPNIVYVVTDDETYGSLDAAMPYLSSKPYGKWVRFDQAVASVANCCPSRSSFLTGQLAHHNGVVDNGNCARYLDDGTLLPVWMHDAGYQTALVGKYLNNYPWDRPASYVPPGWDRWFAYNPLLSASLTRQIVVNDQGASVTFPANNTHNVTDLYATRAVDFAKTAKEPFFLYASTSVPHRPFDRPTRYVGTYANAPVPHSPSFNEADVSDKPQWVQNLPALSAPEQARQDVDQRKEWESTRTADDLVKGVVETLKTRGVLNRTVIVFTSDHGLSFGEHRWKESKNCAYEECIHVPLMVRYPGTTAGPVDNHVVTNVDLGTTIAALGRATPTRPQDGRSAVGLMSGTSSTWTDEALLQKPVISPGGGGVGGGEGGGPGATSDGHPVTPYWGLRTDRYTYVEYLRTGERELYDLQTDPFQLQNVYGRPGTTAVTATLSTRLHQLQQ